MFLFSGSADKGGTFEENCLKKRKSRNQEEVCCTFRSGIFGGTETSARLGDEREQFSEKSGGARISGGRGEEIERCEEIGSFDEI